MLGGETTYEKLIDRRYVGKKETAAYVIFDASESVNAGVFGSRYNLDILKINLNYYTVISLINGIWDIINDTFTGPIVDKTRARWGKLSPCLIAFAIPSLILTLVQWAHAFFPGCQQRIRYDQVFMMLAIQVSGERWERSGAFPKRLLSS